MTKTETPSGKKTTKMFIHVHCVWKTVHFIVHWQIMSAPWQNHTVHVSIVSIEENVLPRPLHASKCLSLCCSLFLTFGFQCWIVEFQQCLIVDPTLNVDFRPLFFLIWTIVKEKKNISHPLIFCNGRSLVWVELWTSNVSSRFCLHSCWMSPGQMLIRKPWSAWKITFPIYDWFPIYKKE